MFFHWTRILLAALFGSAFLLTIRLAAAEAGLRRNPEAALRSPFWINAAELVSPDAAPEQLRLAASLNPRLSPAWIYLGLADEGRNTRLAEAELLEAANADHQYLPAWTLANFYFRQGDAGKFWPWAARAAALTFDDYRPLLRLADALEASPKLVASRLGGGAPLLRAYLDLLIGSDRLDAAEEIARLLLARRDPSDRARIEDLADR